MLDSAWILLLLCLLIGPNSGQDTCVTFNLEDSVESVFASVVDCTGISSLYDFEPWQEGAYDELDVEVNARGTRFIRPTPISGSCARTLEVFPVTDGGTVEVNCFIQMSEEERSDGYVNVYVYNDADDSLVAADMMDSSTDNGWYTMKIEINSYVERAYVQLVGAVSEESLILVDSMRYFDHQGLSESCLIYPDPISSSSSSESDESGEDGTTPLPDSGGNETSESTEESGEDGTTPSPDSGGNGTSESTEESSEDGPTPSTDSGDDGTSESTEESGEDETTESLENSGEGTTPETPDLIECPSCFWNPLLITALVIVSSVVTIASLVYICRNCRKD